MELPVKVEIDFNVRACGRNCAFLNDDECLLFSCDLNETILDEGSMWQDGVDPSRQRDNRCLSFG